MSHQRSAIVVCIDRLGAGYLGPYGNTWIETVQFNRLASRSVLLETAVAETPELARACRSLWTGRHPLCGEAVAAGDSLAGRVHSAGADTILISDDEEVIQHPLAVGFEERIPLAAAIPGFAAADPAETQMAGLFAKALERLAAAEPPFLLWIHSRGMQGDWDAPYELRGQFADEDDPAPPNFVEPPALQFPSWEEFDPDELLGYAHAYAGQLTLADLCLGALLDEMDSLPAAADALLVVVSPRGFPLGEHGAVGDCGDALRGEVLQVPLLVRLPGDEAATRRSHALVQLADLSATLAEWCGVSLDGESIFGQSLFPLIRGERNELRQAACSALEIPSGDSELSIRTPAWFLRRGASGVELYVKPDDRWEVNEVSDRCTEVAEQLSTVLEQHEGQLRSCRRGDSLPPLADELIEGL